MTSNIDPADTHNLHRLVHEGNLATLRSYAKVLIRLADMRRTRTGSPLADSIPTFHAPRGGISYDDRIIATTAPEPVFCVTTDKAIDELRRITQVIASDDENDVRVCDRYGKDLLEAVEAVIGNQE